MYPAYILQHIMSNRESPFVFDLLFAWLYTPLLLTTGRHISFIFFAYIILLKIFFHFDALRSLNLVPYLYSRLYHLSCVRHPPATRYIIPLLNIVTVYNIKDGILCYTISCYSFSLILEK